MEHKPKVLLTGITGFLGSHTAIQLIKKGYFVIGTLRDMSREDHIRKIIEPQNGTSDNLKLVKAELNDPDIWKLLTKDVDYVQHIASPFPRTIPKNDEELIGPAKNGALNILHSAAENGVKRVVMTSSVAAIVYGKQKKELKETFNESHWTDPNNKKDTAPYFRSKAIAEKAAWEYIKGRPGLELTTVCPGAILGPVLEKDFGTSANLVIKLLDGSAPALPNIGFDVVDVRSVADLLILAMEKPSAAGQRFIATAGYLKMKEMAQILRKPYHDKKIPSMVIPDFMVRLFSNIDKTLKPVLIDLGVVRKTDSSKARKELGWEPIPVEEAVLSCAKSVIDLKIVN